LIIYRLLLLYAVAIGAISIGISAGDYPTVYCCVIGIILTYVIVETEITGRILGSYILVYFGIALLNISTYRGYISVPAAQIYLIAIASLLAPMAIIRRRPIVAPVDLRPSQITNAVILAHLAVAWLALIYVYAAIGPIIVRQDLRFRIPTALGYTIRSVQFLPVYMLICRDRTRFWLPLPYIAVLAMFPTLLIASRATLALVLVAMALLVVAMQSYGWQGVFYQNGVLQRFNRPKVRVSIVLGAGVLGLFFIVSGFYLRRSNSDDLISGVEFVRRYFDAGNPISYVLAPIHQGFNETAALTSRVVDKAMVNQQTATPLLWADFDNLLGRSDVAAAQYFGNAVGRAQAGGLTPGLVGGVLLDFRSTYYYWFLGLGIVTAGLRFFGMMDRRVLCVYAIFLSQVFHLLHRGFVKPEYLTIVIIAIFYMLTFTRTRVVLNEPLNVELSNEQKEVVDLSKRRSSERTGIPRL
jgi:hypothetical protein